MLCYYMARMLFLMHQPLSLLKTTYGSSNLWALRKMENNLKSNTIQTFSITNGMLGYEAVRPRALQPLYVAGRAMTEKNDRRRVIEMIRSIQDDLGVPCEYRAVQLIQEWNVTSESLDLQSREVQF